MTSKQTGRAADDSPERSAEEARASDGRPADDLQASDDRPGQTAVRTVRILYVDDADPPSALSEAEAVSLSAVPTASAAREALASDGDVDCVVSEYALPDDDGLALLEAVRDDHPNLPFVFYTGSGSEAVASEAFGVGATDYLPKDTDGETLRERVERAVASASVETESGVTGDRLRELTNAFPDEAFVLDENGRYLEVLSGPATRDLRTVEQERLVGKRLHDAFPTEQADRFLELIHRTLDTGGVETIEYCAETDRGERWYEGRTAPLGDTIDGREAVVWVARDVTERRENERRLAESRDELTRLTRINDLINDTLKSLVGSATREEIERVVCEELANSEFYQFAWVGGPWVKDEQMAPSAVAGVEPEAIERLVEATSAQTDAENAFSRVVSDDESVVVGDVADSDIISERERELMEELEMSSAVLVPLTYGTTNYGVLGISGACTGTFGDRELTALETLGEIVGFAINAVKNRNLLLSDTAVELEFRVENPERGFGRISAELDCRFSLEGLVGLSDDQLLEYVSVEGASADALTDRLDDCPTVDEYRLVTDDDDVCLFEIRSAQSGVTQLVEAGTVVTSATAEGGVVRCVAEASSDVSVRNVVEDFRTTYPDAELVSKQEVDRPVHTTQEFRQTLAENLTEKQRTALQAAYFAGYYEYPRESTGAEVAESLDVSSPTLHQHLQAAQKKLVGTFLDLQTSGE
ncbi:helix-turn-helix domain-containing protein [Halorussus gelatinilyticus]|uniref:Helix-turn-helix domain-containing protein n=1 Tax=Halorussus gelatinilyticus TaxID=2937524 RepID=A0A8U0IG59_9EURY|nr:bacterio-opsin activator domain-containing protein [Halorussus gelatinilyticus]UPW00070.1 helix-turn-helix domain-containing protein [Halorussus gelatinilyticus]